MPTAALVMAPKSGHQGAHRFPPRYVELCRDELVEKYNGTNIRLVQELLRHSNPAITLDAYTRSTTPAKIEAQGWVMRQLLPESPNDELCRAKPVGSRTM